MTGVESGPESALIEEYKQFSGVEIIIHGMGPQIIPGETSPGDSIWHVVSELVSNCVNNRLPGQSGGATEVTVSFQPGQVTVSDNFVYTNPEEILNKLITIRDSGRPFTTKQPEEGESRAIGGAGIFTSVRRLRELEGQLDYSVKDGTIVATATWNPDLVTDS